MKLRIVTPFLENKGGLERVILKIAEYFDATIHCLNYDSENTFPEFKNLDIQFAKKGFLSKLPLSKRMSSAIEAGKYFYNLKLDDYDVINAHQTPSEWISNKNKRVIWYCHTPNREAYDLYKWRMKNRGLFSKAMFWTSIEAFKFIEKRTVPKIDYIFTNSLNSKERIKKYLNRESEILYPAVDIEKFNCSSYDKFFFYPSRIVPEKRIEYAIEGFKKFSIKNKGWKLIVAGGLSNKFEHKNYLERLKLICNEDISIEINVNDERLIELYSKCFSVLYTPVNEDFGLVPLEAFASSKPCIAVNEGGPKETIIDGVDGFLINNSDELAQKMEFLINNESVAYEMGKNGLDKVKKKFSWKAFFDRFEKKAKEMSK